MSTIVTRAGKGSPLTNNEVDSNFTNLNTDKIQVTGTPTTGQAIVWNGTAWVPGSAGVGDVVGPASSTDNALTRFDGTTGKLVQNSTATLSDTGAMATANVTSDYYAWNTGAGVTPGVGQRAWDANQGTTALGLLGGNVITRDGQSLVAYVTNAEAVTITKGQAVYLFSAVGDRASVKLAYNTADAASAKTLGLVAEDIAAGASGFVMCQGVAYKMDTSAYAAGDSLYLGATAGSITTTKPYAPNHLVYIGTVEKANAGNGQIYVRVQNGYEMDELHNVSAQSPSNGNTLVYNTSTSLWEASSTLSGSYTLSGGTANGVTYLNGSKVLTSGSALTFDGTNLLLGNTASTGLSTGQLQVGTASVSDSAIQMLSNTTGTSGVYFGDGTTGGDRYRGAIEYANNGDILKFYSGSSAQLNLTSTSLYTASGINVGIGTSTIPSGRRLIVESSGDTVARINSGGASSGLSFEFANNGTLRGGIGNGSGNITFGNAADMAIQANANLVFASGGYAQTMRLDSAGNLGLGVTPSAWSGGKAFEIGAQGNSLWSYNGNAGDIRLLANAYWNNSNYIYSTTAPAASYQVVSGAHYWQIAASGTAGTNISFTQAMTLDASGNLGLGTTSPTGFGTSYTVLDVYNGTVGGYILARSPNVTGQVSVDNNTAMYVQTRTNHPIVFSLNNTERARIDSSGNLGIGTSSPAQTLHVKTSTSATPITLGVLSNATGLPALSFNGAYASTTMAGIYANGATSTSLYYEVPSGNSHFWGIADSTKMTLDSAGNLGLGVTPSAWRTSGDKALQIGSWMSLFTDSGVTAEFASNTYISGASQYLYSNTGSATRYRQYLGKHEWYTAPSDTAGNAITWNQVMTLDASGNLGVGTTSPAAKIDVRGTSTTAFGSRNGVLLYNTNSSGNQSNIIGFGSTGSATAACFISTDNPADGSGIYALTLGATTSSGVINFLTNGSERARIDSSGNLGVGTTSPAAKLHVVNTVYVKGSASSDGDKGITIGSGSGAVNTSSHAIRTGGGLGDLLIIETETANSSGQIVFQTNNAERARIDSSGNLGLGVTPSAWASVKAIEVGELGGAFAGGGNNTLMFYNAYFNSGFKYANSSRAASYYQQTAGQHIWYNAPSSGVGGAGTAISFTQAMTLDASGRLGIGETSPTTTLDVKAAQGRIKLTSSTGTNNALVFFNNTGGNAYVGLDNSGGSLTSPYALNLYHEGAYPITFSTNNAERARISSAGGFSVGTTADPGAGAIYATGNITAYYSDDRLKTRLGNIENALDKVDQLQGFYYEANETAQALGYKPKREVGVSAQSVQAVLPEIVSPAPIDQQYLTLDYERLVPLLIEAVKELRAEVKALKGE